MGFFDELLNGQNKESLYKYFKLLKIRKHASNYKIKKASYRYSRYAAKKLLLYSNSERIKNYKNSFDYYNSAMKYLNPFSYLDSDLHLRIDPKFLKDLVKCIDEIMANYEKPLSGNFLELYLR